MQYFTDYQYGLQQVTAVCTDTTNGNYVWVAFAQNNGACLLKKVSAFDPLQVYYTVSVPVTSINAMVVSNGYVFLAVNHATYFAIAYSVSNPLTTFITLNYPSGVTEAPIAVLANGTSVYFLTPGIPVKTAKIIQVSNVAVYQATIILTQVSPSVNVQNASCFTVNTVTGDFWIATNTAPVILTRAYLVTSVWTFANTSL